MRTPACYATLTERKCTIAHPAFLVSAFSAPSFRVFSALCSIWPIPLLAWPTNRLLTLILVVLHLIRSILLVSALLNGKFVIVVWRSFRVCPTS